MGPYSAQQRLFLKVQCVEFLIPFSKFVVEQNVAVVPVDWALTNTAHFNFFTVLSRECCF